jgi:hypothetical protein
MPMKAGIAWSRMAAPRRALVVSVVSAWLTAGMQWVYGTARTAARAFQPIQLS